MHLLNISNDFFIRTTDELHKLKVQEVLQRVHDNGHVYKGMYEGWYCPRCADFKVENEILEGNLCPIHEIPLTREREENWFFRLSSFQGAIERHFAAHPDFVMPGRAMHEAQAFVTQGLQDISLCPRQPEVGSDGPVGSEPCLLRLVRRAPQLLHGPLLRAARRGPDRSLLAASVPHHRQGHPQVPYRLLARDAACRRSAGSRARLRPRVPARLRRAQDEQVAG